MQVSEYIEYVASEGEMFAAAAGHGDLTVEIAPCPGWTMRDLVRHLGMIHLWAAANLRFPEPDWLNVDDLPDLVRYWPELTGPTGQYPPDDELVAWYRKTHANLLDVLRTSPPDVVAFAFLPAPSPLSMWARRQASEIAIHRFDAEQPRGITTQFSSAFATDMLDELMCGFAIRPRDLDLDTPQVIHVHTTDTDEHWWSTIGSRKTETSREGDHADLTLSGSAADLYLLLWNRTPNSPVAMDGKGELLDLWHNNFRVRWS